jgi:hypothetical protein
VLARLRLGERISHFAPVRRHKDGRRLVTRPSIPGPHRLWGIPPGSSRWPGTYSSTG